MPVPSADKVVAPNRLREARLAAGIPTAKEVAARIPSEPTVYIPLEKGLRYPSEIEFGRLPLILGRPVEWLFPDNHADIRARLADGTAGEVGDVSAIYGVLAGPQRLLVRPEELTWTDRHPRPGRHVDVFLSLSCSTQQAPNLLQDTVAVCEALGVDFVAAAGPGGCCGSPAVRLLQKGEVVGQQWVSAKARKLTRLGVTTNVNWCTGCQINVTREMERRETEEGVRHPLREVQILTFLEERVRELGDRVPWKREVRRRVAAEGHWFGHDIHRTAQLATTRLLAMVPGVEVVGTYEGHSPGSPCAYRARHGIEERAPHLTDLVPEPRTIDEVRERRERLADELNAMGADTVSCQHQDCHLLWSYYASERLSVVHGVSVLAEALGVRHPDRYQAAARLADPEAVLEQTRPVWTAWNMPEDEAREHAYELADPRFAARPTLCACGNERCDEKVITVDVLTATIRPAATALTPSQQPEH
jgi:hypothetical protein